MNKKVIGILVIFILYVIFIASLDKSTRECLTCGLELATVIAVVYAIWDRWSRKNEP